MSSELRHIDDVTYGSPEGAFDIPVCLCRFAHMDHIPKTDRAAKMSIMIQLQYNYDFTISVQLLYKLWFYYFCTTSISTRGMV